MEMIRSGMEHCGGRMHKMDLDVYKITDRLQDRDVRTFTMSCPIDPSADSKIQVTHTVAQHMYHHQPLV